MSEDLPDPEEEAKPFRFPYTPVTELELSSPENFLWDNMVARGRLTVFHSEPKLGKTTLISHLIQAIDRGQPFLGLDCAEASMFICSEESPAQWVDRAEELGLSESVFVHCRPEVSGGDWEGWSALIRDTLDQAVAAEAELVILDTINDFWPVENEIDNVQIIKALRCLNPLLDAGLGVLVVAHSRKGGGNEIGSLRGGSGFSGKGDMVIQLAPASDDPQSLFRRLNCRGRFPNYPRRLDIEMGLDGYAVSQQSEDRRTSLRREVILKAMPVGEENAVSGRQLGEMSATRSRKVLTARLRELEDHPQVCSKRESSGTTLYWLSRPLDPE